MQNNSIHKTIHRNVGSNEVNRLYKFIKEDEMTSFIETLNKFFTRSTTILDKGKFNQNKKQFIDSIATETWEELNLDGNFFIFTRENLSYKTDEQTKMEKVIKKNLLHLTETPQPRKYKVDWTEEEIKQLYSGTIKEVAEKLNKSYSKVYEKRKIYEIENPDFVIPEIAIYKREKKAKSEKTKAKEAKVKEVKPEVKFKETIQDLTLKEVEILWDNTSAELRQKYPDVFKSIFVIHAMRTEYCKLNPQFVIPSSANFNSAHLPNMTEAKQLKQAKRKEKEDITLTSELTADEMSVLWDANGKEVGKLLSKPYQAIYAARCNYCRNNPEFVIPHIASFNPPSDCTNKIEEKPMVKMPEVNEIAKPEIQPEIVAEAAKAVQPQVEQPNNVMTEMAEMLKVMMANGMKPSKVTLDNGKIVCEF